MKTPQEKYDNDPQYRNLVQIFEATIHQAEFTPSEIREAAVYACIRYEMYHLHHKVFIPKDVATAFGVLERFRETGHE